MPRKVNTSYLGNNLDESLDTGKKTMIKVDHVSMVFNIANQKLNSLKEWFIALVKHEIRFKEFRALDDVSFEVKQGDVFGILGTNGSGKSTMLKIVAGVLEPTEGTVEVNGKISPLIELGAGFDMDLTARENVYLNGALLGYPKKFIDEHMDDIIEFAEIEDFMDMPLKNYSSGMVARIAFSIATVIVPEILIVDEVLSVGDFMFQRKCESRITDIIKNDGVTVLIVSHNNAQIERLCNKAIWIEKGHTRMMGSAHDVCRAYRVVGGREGSAESEARVIDTMGTDIGNYKRYCDELSGNDRYATCVKVAKACEEGRDEVQGTVVLAPSDDITSAVAASALSEVEDALLLNTGYDFLQGATHGYLRKVRPEHVIIVDATGKVKPEVGEVLEEDDIEVTSMVVDGKTELCLRVYGYGKAHGDGWGTTAIISYDNAVNGLISLLPFICHEKSPFFALSPDDPALNDEVCAVLTGDGFEKVIIVEQGFLVDASVVGKLENAGIEVVRFSDDDPCRINKEIDRWIIAEREKAGLSRVENLLMSTVWEPIDAYFVGPYTAKKDYLVLFANPNNLDETVHNFDFLDELDGDISHLTFVGGKSRFSEDDRSISVKSMVASRHMAGKLMPGEKPPDEEQGKE